MASNPQGAPMLPLFYQSLAPLSSQAHAGYKIRVRNNYPEAARTHAVPLTVDEFSLAMKHYPIVFGSGEGSAPLALFGLSDGINHFVDADGNWKQDVYIPAYIRRYPFMLARLRPDAEELSLCFDPTSGLVGEFEDGNALFDGEAPSEVTNQVLKFCEEFEMSAQRTNAFMKELKESELLIDGEVSIQPSDSQQPFVYRGFQMVDEQKLRDAHGDKLRKMNQNGMLPLLFAHLFSLPLIREIFGKQMQQGKVPPQGEVAGNA